jgi:hypothetical protein
MNLHVSIGGVDVTDLTLFNSEIRKDSSDSISTATLHFLSDFDRLARYDDGTSFYDSARYAFRPTEWQEVVLTDDSATRQFAGYITSIEREQIEGNITKYVCSCSDYGILLDRTTVNTTYLNESDEDIILDAFTGVSGITVNASNIALLVADLATFEAKDITLRELLENICELTGGEWRVDYNRNLLYYASGSIAAPFGLSDEPDGVTTFKHGIESLTRDFSNAANRITVLGGLTDGGTEISAAARNLESQAKYGVLSATVVDRNIPDQATAELRARAELAQRAFPSLNGRVKTWKDGLDVGQTITITNKPYAISQSFVIRSISVTFIRPGAALDNGDGLEYRAEYDIEFGQRQPDLIAALRRLERQAKQSTSTPVANVPPAAIRTDNFAATIQPVHLVSAKPSGAEWNAYPDDAIFLLTTDRKLYRRNGNDWTAAVPTVDLTGVIEEIQIASAAVTEAKLAAAAVTETKIASDAVSSPKIVAGAVLAGKIATGAVETDKLAAGAVTAGKIGAAAVEAGKIAAGAVTAGTIAADAVTAGTLAAGAIRAVDAVFENGAIRTADIADAQITNAKISTLSADKITSGTIDAGTITVTNLNASNITTGSLNGTRLADGSVADSKIISLDADKITAGTINASIITVTNLNASNITSGSMSVSRLTSGTMTVASGQGIGITDGSTTLTLTPNGIARAFSVIEMFNDVRGYGYLRADGGFRTSSNTGISGSITYAKPGGGSGTLYFNGGIIYDVS